MAMAHCQYSFAQCIIKVISAEPIFNPITNVCYVHMAHILCESNEHVALFAVW